MCPACNPMCPQVKHTVYSDFDVDNWCASQLLPLNREHPFPIVFLTHPSPASYTPL